MQPNPNGVVAIPIRKAIKMALRKLYIARETSNRDTALEIYQWLKTNVKKRNITGLNVYIQRGEYA